MKPALLLLDLQHDFLERPGLDPAPGALVGQATRLLEFCRRQGIAVFHVQTRIRADGGDRMPHWAASDTMACVAGSRGAAPPSTLAPEAGEAVFPKRFFNGFGNRELEPALAAAGVDTLILAGLYLHACVRATATEAYERGFRVWLAEDAVGSTEPAHGELSREWMTARVATFLSVVEIVQRLAGDPEPSAPAPTRRQACIGGEWLTADSSAVMVRHRPDDRHRIFSVVPLAGDEVVRRAVASASGAWPEWRDTPMAARLAGLARWHAALTRARSSLQRLMVAEIGKPVTGAREEMTRALAHLSTATRASLPETTVAEGVVERLRPHGCCALVTPWNNPVAIAVGKIAPALAYGNSVVWKPSPKASAISEALMETLAEATLPAGVVNLIHGGQATARALMRNPQVAAVSLTGSRSAGNTASALCLPAATPLQAELGGNNAAIVMADADLAAAAADLARAAFGFSGQRCTAVRRVIVERPALAAFESHFADAVTALRIGDPARPDTDIGPLIDDAQLAHIEDIVASAQAAGARLVCGGSRPPGLEGGCWYRPTVLADVAEDADVVMRESFGPVAVLLAANDLDTAITLANAVPQGLLAAIATRESAVRERFANEMAAGILRTAAGPPALDPDAAFVGWKASGIGPPEHGRWDRDFYTRAQALYQDVDGDPPP